jgi:hypothetical protein
MSVGIADHLAALGKFLQSNHQALGDAVCVFAIPLVPLLLLGFQDARPDARIRGIAIRLAGLLVLVYASIDAAIMVSNVMHPQEWDVGCNWFNGYVAVHGFNFYDPESYRRLAGVLPDTPDVVKFVISVGFNFPPPTIFLFLPLGFFDIHTASVLWYAFMVGVVVLDVVLLARLFLPTTPNGPLLAAALLLVMRPAMSTVWFGQTNFLIVLMLLLFWRDRDAGRGGVWLGLGMLVKPLFAILILYPVICRRWRTVAVTALVLAALSCLTIAVFGWETFAAYFARNPLGRMPADVYTEDINQSLLAAVLRLTRYDFIHGSPLTHPVFVFLAAGLTAATAWLVHRADASGNDDLALALMVPFALLVYPGTLAHYSVDLLVPMLALWARRRELPGGVPATGLFITLEYALINAAGSLAIVANGLAWFGIAAMVAYRVVRVVPTRQVALEG